jgi:hypothetical protein
VGYFYPSELEKSFCKSDIYIPLVTKGLINFFNQNSAVQTATHNKSTCVIRISITEFINVTINNTSFPKNKKKDEILLYTLCVC